MNKKVIYTLSTAFLLSGLTACNNADEGAMGNDYNGTRQVGYYSDENANGNAILPERDNDGPVTEMLDRTADNDDYDRDRNTNNRGVGNIGTRDDGFIDDRGNNGARNVGFNNNLTRGNYGQYNNYTLDDYGNNQGVNNPTRPYGNDNGMARNNQYSRTDYNYHGQMADRDNNKKSSYNNNYNGRLAEEISNRAEQVANVEDVRTIISGNEVLVAVDTNDRNDVRVKDKVRAAIQSVAAGKDVKVVTDESIFTRARNIDNELQDGGPTDDLDADVRDMFQEIGEEIDDAVRTPFRDTK
ncbi:YhcN/YlaJ family sporulation lipoprotein [Bacillus pinisoli]|uniref:YhcN/YlaJ family sporulation lipoprotein n=1 Tax=Bacillus pinisoli TaxID=2901866 RepID=UPI001FF37975|nr:YhcN/YlaJ family sporulation lipoprotein [Bacillus pinisoli]